ncbi:MAG: hypothetical protein HOE90_18360 [Bacteriovoracaceae bacterium]|jgi:hypothetical protein|nr:hypothetical protein [Bacteriovoracaceae bacterium]
MNIKLFLPFFIKAALFVCVVISSSCTQKRAEEFVQGGGENLTELSAYQGHTFEVETGEIEGITKISKAEVVEIDPELGIKNHPIVKLKKSHPLLNGFNFRGKPHTTYQIVTLINKGKLEVFKYCKRDELSIQELGFARIYKSGFLVPLVYYPVEFFRIDHVQNESGEDTHKKKEFSVPGLDGASHIKFSSNSQIEFNNLYSLDVYPKTVLNYQNDWFLSVTVVETSGKEKASTGAHLSYDFSFKDISRVKINPVKDGISIVSLNKDNKIKVEGLDADVLIYLPVDRLKYKTIDGERVVFQSGSSENAWKSFHFMKINFDKIVAYFLEGEEEDQSQLHYTQRDRGISLDSNQITSLELSPDYISFNIKSEKDKAVFKVSLKKAHPQKAPRIYFEEDLKKYGFFVTSPDVIQDHHMVYKENFDGNRYLSRFMPDNGKIIYHFSKNSPKGKLRDVAIKSIRAWDQAFIDAKTGIRVEVDEDHDVALGDVRYNVINIVDSDVQEAWLLGYGPSLTDHLSGEIISATSNLYAGPMKQILIGTLQDYILSELHNLGDQKSMVTPTGQLVNNFNTNTSSLVDYSNSHQVIGSPYHMTTYLVPNGDLTPKQYESRSSGEFLTNNQFKIITKERGKKQQRLRGRPAFDYSVESEKKSGSCNFAISQKSFIEKVKGNCDELGRAIKSAKKSNRTRLSNRVTLLETCAEKLVPEMALATLVHEMGHNFGLRHNFAGSTDKDNFYPKEKTNGISVESSTVMEYSSSSAEELEIPGSYDVEALRFGYANAITPKVGEVRPLKLDRNLEEQGFEIKKFKFCTDQDVMMRSTMCDRFDKGVTSLEVVDDLILTFNSRYLLRYQRLGRKRSLPWWWLNYINSMTVYHKMKSIYDDWRNKLYEFMGKEDKYLVGMSTEDFQATLDKMKADEKYGPIYENYRPAVEKIFDFLTNLVKTPDQFCLVSGGSGNEFIRFSKVRARVLAEKGQSIVKCDHELAQSYFAENQMVLLDELGLPRFNFINEDNLEELDPAVDQVGLIAEQLSAMVVLSERFYFTSMNNWQRDFAPSFMDEPIFKAKIKSYMLERFTEGINPKGFDYKTKEISHSVSLAPHLTEYSKDKSYFDWIFRIFKWGLYIPDTFKGTLDNLAPYQFNYERMEQAADEHDVSYKIKGSDLYLVADSENDFAKTILERAIEVRDLLEENTSEEKQGGMNSGEYSVKDHEREFGSPLDRESEKEESTEEEAAAVSTAVPTATSPTPELAVEEVQLSPREKRRLVREQRKKARKKKKEAGGEISSAEVVVPDVALIDEASLPPEIVVTEGPEAAGELPPLAIEIEPTSIDEIVPMVLLPFPDRLRAAATKVGMGENFLEFNSSVTVEEFMERVQEIDGGSEEQINNPEFKDFEEDVKFALMAIMAEEIKINTKLQLLLSRSDLKSEEIKTDELESEAEADEKERIRRQYIIRFADNNYGVDLDFSVQNLLERVEIYLKNRYEKSEAELDSQLDFFHFLFF